MFQLNSALLICDVTSGRNDWLLGLWTVYWLARRLFFAYFIGPFSWTGYNKIWPEVMFKNGRQVCLHFECNTLNVARIVLIDMKITEVIVVRLPLLPNVSLMILYQLHTICTNIGHVDTNIIIIICQFSREFLSFTIICCSVSLSDVVWYCASHRLFYRLQV